MVTLTIDIVKRYQNSKGQNHRLEGPAIFWSDGSYIWCLNDKGCAPEKHPFNIFRKEYFLSDKYEEWPKDKQMLFKLTYGGSI